MVSQVNFQTNITCIFYQIISHSLKDLILNNFKSLSKKLCVCIIAHLSSKTSKSIATNGLRCISNSEMFSFVRFEVYRF